MCNAYRESILLVYLGTYQALPQPLTCSPSRLQYSMTQPTYHYDTYREELGKAYPIFGQALWDPDPGDYPPVEVGDVGFTRRGKFHRLFNTLLREDHPSHQSLGYGLPEYYEQLKILSPNPISYGTLRSTDLHSSGVDMSGGLAATVPGPVG
jgi:hypothetical protein